MQVSNEMMRGTGSGTNGNAEHEVDEESLGWGVNQMPEEKYQECKKVMETNYNAGKVPPWKRQGDFQGWNVVWRYRVEEQQGGNPMGQPLENENGIRRLTALNEFELMSQDMRRDMRTPVQAEIDEKLRRTRVATPVGLMEVHMRVFTLAASKATQTWYGLSFPYMLIWEDGEWMIKKILDMEMEHDILWTAPMMATRVQDETEGSQEKIKYRSWDQT